MMDFVINSEEIGALYGLLHAQQIMYLRGIRPFMDVKSGLVGIKRRISLQSLAEELYVEPHPGIRSEKYSRAQVRRALAALERSGLITLQSENKQLILKCNLAKLGYFSQNKPVTNQSYETITTNLELNPLNQKVKEDYIDNSVTLNHQKADTPLIKDNINIYLLQQFEFFWSLYPEKKSRERTFQIFKQISPDKNLLQKIVQSLKNQIKAYQHKEARGEWVPPWKFPANWLLQKCWEDEIKITKKQEKINEKNGGNHNTTLDPFWNPKTEAPTGNGKDEFNQSNVVKFQCYRKQ